MDARARSTTIMAQPDRIDDGIALINDELMPMMTDIDGYMGVSLLVDRSSGRCIATTSWESDEAMRASSAQVQPDPPAPGRHPGRGRPRRSRSGRSRSSTVTTSHLPGPALG